MADLNSSKVYGALTVAHDAVIKRDLQVDGNTDIAGILTADNPSNSLAGSLVGNASSSTKLETARSIGISLSGDVTGSASVNFDGTSNITISASTTIAANSVALGTDTTGNYVAGNTAGSYILVTGTAGEGWSPTIAVDATSANTASKVVARDASGNFSAGTITAALSGNASTATSAGKWTTARTHTVTLTGDVTGTAGVSVDGSGNWTNSIATTVANDSHTHSDYITSNANDTATGIYNFSNTTDSSSGSTGAIYTAGGIGVTKNVYVGGTLTEASDERIKSDISIIDNPIDKVKSLNGYTYLKDNVEKRMTGVIAQEVLKVLPEAVTTSEDGMYSVAYGNMVGLLIEAIKEQQKQIEELKSIINSSSSS